MSAMQFNLLPDVKLEFIKAERSKKVVASLALLVGGVALAILIIMLFTVDVVQKKQLTNAKAGVTAANSQLASDTGLSKILTVQNQLNTLVGLHNSKHISSRTFTLLQEVVPSTVEITQTIVDYSLNSIAITGTANGQLSVNTFIDTLKFAQYKASSTSSELPIFSDVVESAFSLTTDGSTYTIDAQFDPAFFANVQNQTPQIILKNQVTTRSVLEDPNSGLFGAQPKAGN